MASGKHEIPPLSSQDVSILDKVWDQLSPEYLQGWRDAYENNGKQSADADYLEGYQDQSKVRN